MTRRLLTLTTATAALLAPAGTLTPAAAGDLLPYVTVDAAPAGAKVAAGEHFDAADLSNTRPVSAGAVGPLPVFYADDEFGCVWTTAISSGITEWIALARRSVATGSDHCGFFQQKVVAATLAGADALILINNALGTATGLAAGTIPGVIIDQAQGTRLRESLVAGNPNAVKVTLGLLDSETFLPPGAPSPTTVQSVQASGGSGTLTVTGSAAFGGQAALSVATDPTGDAPGPAELGLDMTAAKIGQPDPETGNLVFTLDVTQLPDTGGIPELVRYSWDFAVRRGTAEPKPFQIDGRFTDVIRRQSTRMPSFVLRGNCTDANNQITCTDVAFLDTVADASANRIKVTVPRSLLEQQVGGPIAGAVIEPVDICEGISSKLGVHSTLCNAQGQETGDEIFPEDTTNYAVAAPAVEMGIVPSGSAPVYTTQAAVSETGAFAGTLNTSGLAPGAYDVVVRACFGTNCGTASRSITL